MVLGFWGALPGPVHVEACLVVVAACRAPPIPGQPGYVVRGGDREDRFVVPAGLAGAQLAVGRWIWAVGRVNGPDSSFRLVALEPSFVCSCVRLCRCLNSAGVAGGHAPAKPVCGRHVVGAVVL